jgi:hypothetical protein
MYRQKQVEITDEIVAQIEKVTQTTLDINSVVVFESVAASTRPISKHGSLYNGAMMSRQLLMDMAQAVNSGTESVPLHTLHRQNEELPVGRVFSAWVQDVPDGSTDLHAYFYMSSNETDIIEKINLSVLDEVSVGVKSKQAMCSKCGFDYFGPDADFTHLFSQTCDNGHTIGLDNAHLKLSGMDLWSELSLVSRGASNKPKILSRARTSVSQEAMDRMAASGTPVEAALLVLNLSEMESPMPPEIETEAAPVVEAEAAVETTPAIEAEPAEAEAEAEPVVETEAEAEEEPAEFDAGAAIAALRAQIDALEAQMAPEPDPEPTIEELQAQLATANLRIAEMEVLEAKAEPAPVPTPKPNIPLGGVAASAVGDAQTLPSSQLVASAFKTRKPRK